jgi:hypothetical protein
MVSRAPLLLLLLLLAGLLVVWLIAFLHSQF